MSDEFTWQEAFNYGLPTVLLIFGCIALWRAAIWARTKVVEPVVEAHVKTMNTFSAEMPKQTAELREMKACMQKLSGDLSNICHHEKE